MNAPALNPASAPPAGSVGTVATAAVAGKASGALAGFEALLGALFPQGTGPATTPVAAATPGAVTLNAALTVTTDGKTPELAEADAEQLSGDANAALLASALTAPVQITNPVPDLQPVDPSAGQVKAAPSAPVIFSADPKAGAGEAPATEDEGLPDLTTRAGDLVPEAPRRTDAALPSPALAQAGRSGTPLQPSTTELPDSPAPVIAAAASGTAAAEITPVQAATVTPPPTLAATGQVARQEPAPAGPVRSARSDKGRAASDLRPAGEPSPLPADDLIATASTAKPVNAVAPTPIAGPEKAEAATRDIDVASDAPDATLQAEARTAAQTLTPIATGAQAVRGSPETVATLAAQIIKKLEGQSTRFDVELNPAGLGKVDVRIDIGAHGRISAAMMFDNPAAAADLRARATELQRMLEQAGFDMSGGLSFDVAGDRGQQQRQAWQDQNDNASQAFRGQAFRAALDTAGNATDTAIEGALRLRRGVNAGLDLRI